MKDEQKLPRSCGTHDGTFHADEVTACALLVMFGLIDKEKIVRTREPERLCQCEYVCDVGGAYNAELKLFDHHQVDYQGKLSSAGMVLQYLLDEKILDQSGYNFFNNTLVRGVDEQDNGLTPQIVGLCTYSDLLADFTPIRYDVKPEEQDAAFFEALEFVITFLRRKWERYQYVRSCRNIVEQVMNAKSRFLLFEQAIPWMDAFFDLGGLDHPAQFVVMPTGKHWKLRGIPPSLEEKMEVRFPLPKEWAGLLENELKGVSGIEGAIFCHKGRFISVWETKEDALQAMEFIFNQEKERS